MNPSCSRICLSFPVVILSLGLVWSLIALWRDINRRLRAEGALRKEAAFRRDGKLPRHWPAGARHGRPAHLRQPIVLQYDWCARRSIGDGLPPMPYWAPEVTETYQERFAQILTGHGAAEAYETIYQRANGERFPVLIR